MERDESNITRRVLLMGLEGLGHECKQVTDMLGLPNIMFNLVSKGEIKNAIARISKMDMKEDMLNSKKVGDRLTDNPMDNAYMTYISLPNSRIWMRYRARSIAGVKVNNKRSVSDLKCRFCKTK